MRIKKIEQKDQYTFSIQWADDRINNYRLSDLQATCPCAICCEKRRKGPLSVDKEVMARRLSNIGRYAIRIEFTSGCSKGIYTFAFLRQKEGEL